MATWTPGTVLGEIITSGITTCYDFSASAAAGPRARSIPVEIIDTTDWGPFEPSTGCGFGLDRLTYPDNVINPFYLSAHWRPDIMLPWGDYNSGARPMPTGTSPNVLYPAKQPWVEFSFAWTGPYNANQWLVPGELFGGGAVDFFGPDYGAGVSFGPLAGAYAALVDMQSPNVLLDPGSMSVYVWPGSGPTPSYPLDFTAFGSLPGMLLRVLDDNNFIFVTPFVNYALAKIVVVQAGVIASVILIPPLGALTGGAINPPGVEQAASLSWLALSGQHVVVSDLAVASIGDDVALIFFDGSGSTQRLQLYLVNLPTPWLARATSAGYSVGYNPVSRFWSFQGAQLAYASGKQAAADTSVLRLAQRNDGLGLSAHPRLSVGAGSSSQQRASAPRVGTNNTYI